MTILRRFLSSNLAVFLFVAGVHGVTTRGSARQAVDTELYVTIADQIRAGNWSGVFDPSRVLWTKTIYLVILAAARSISAAHWPLIMVAVNVACSAGAAVLLVALMRRASASIAAMAVALAFYVTCFDVFLWMRWVLTDPLYSFVALAVFVLAARPIVEPGAPRRYALLAAALTFAVFTRPPGLVLVALTVVAALWFWPRATGGPRLRRGLLAVVLIALAVAVAFRTWILHDPNRWPTDVLRPKIAEFAEREKTGEVLYDRKEAFRPPPRTYADHLVIEADRFVRFFQITAATHSRAHNAYNLLYFAALYLLGIFGAVHAFRSGDRRRRDLVRLTLLWIFGLAAYHALTVLDYDWRFRTPVMPQFMVLAAFGAEALLQRVTWRRTSSAARTALSSSK
jgi:4-amino-4-deoxy-L-arabinose transferase-like glycosyltransferase